MKRRNHRPDWRRIKSLRSYTIEETARLLQVHRNAVRYWIKGGLPVLADQRPHLIHGGDLAVFLRERRQAKKQTCGPGRFFCMTCRHPRPPADGMVDYKPITSARGIGKPNENITGFFAILAEWSRAEMPSPSNDNGAPRETSNSKKEERPIAGFDQGGRGHD
jgi:hypothetical protein